MQIKPMCKKFIVHKKKKYNNCYDIVTFSVRLNNDGYTLIPRLKYTKVLRNQLTKYQDGCTGYDDHPTKKVKNPLLTRIIHFFHDKLKYGNFNKIRRMYNKFYDNYIFKKLNQGYEDEIKHTRPKNLNNCEKCHGSYKNGYWCQLPCFENSKIKTPKGFCEFCK